MRKKQTKAARVQATPQERAYKQGAKVRRKATKLARAARYGALSAVAAATTALSSAKAFAQGLWQS